ncbi:hypothetical protein GCK72_010979 [Caenorhabditis remanei]|uniref:BHLH domain-containing protein n=1 Tax=Caenorhabditis remanei TaxID=31234 RepID=A0A6A5H6A1_CAERE|nr:hypothetical protein GCK72_010979 [Caenorhabditis remanei]KAF1762717.1 hypothetical protein GCK72_010979 [Caenorhabditis remanei]
MESIVSQLVQMEKSRKKQAEERRAAAVNIYVKKQPAVLILVAETLNQVDLKSKYPAEARRKREGGKMTRETEKLVKAKREQVRRDKITDSLDSMREFITRNSLGAGYSKKLEQLTVVKIILEYIRTLPVKQADAQNVPNPFSIAALIAPPSTPSSGLPTLAPTPPLPNPQSPSTPGLPDILPTGTAFSYSPMFNCPCFPTIPPFQPILDPAALQTQFRFQMMIQNLLNQNKNN